MYTYLYYYHYKYTLAFPVLFIYIIQVLYHILMLCIVPVINECIVLRFFFTVLLTNIHSTRCLFMGKIIRSTRCYLWVKIYVPIGVYLWIKLYVPILIFYL